MPYKILILDSVRDDSAARRELHVVKDEQLRCHQFQHIYATEPAELGATVPLATRMAQVQKVMLDEKELLARLTERVDAYGPDILLVHSGSVFQNFPDQTLFVLRSLKASHPQLRIAFRPSAFEKYPPRPFFEYTAEMQALMERVFA